MITSSPLFIQSFNKAVNLLKKLVLRSWPYFVLGEVGAEDCCPCCGVRGELE